MKIPLGWPFHELKKRYRLDIGLLTSALMRHLGSEYAYAVSAKFAQVKGIKSLAKISHLQITCGSKKVALLEVLHGGGKIGQLPQSHGGEEVIMPDIVTCGNRLFHSPQLAPKELQKLNVVFNECHVDPKE